VEVTPRNITHRDVMYVSATATVTRDAGYIERDYRVWWCPEFPMSDLGYGSNRPLWRYETDRPWRAALLKDFEARGQINPCLVWNHEARGHAPKPWENYVKVGRNKCWVMRELGFKTAKCLVAADVAPLNCASYPVTPENILEHWLDGDLRFERRGLTSTGCTDPAKLHMPTIE
jgi:hypothetical protein